VFGILKRKRDLQKLAEADADRLLAGYGDRAYAEARDRARDAHKGSVVDGNRSRDHWDRVRQIIAKKSGRQHVDVATSYLD
jgi:hypothetical protein